MTLVAIAPPAFDVELALAYATPDNITGRPIYRRALCFLHPDAAAALSRAVALAGELGLRVRIFDAFRPPQAQWALWNHTPDPEFLADPRKGSPHTRGVAVDLTLLDGAGRPLEMGTGFDDFTPRAHHGAGDLPRAAKANRMTLLGIMTCAGWDFYRNEWWHYQLFDSRRYPLVGEDGVPDGMM